MKYVFLTLLISIICVSSDAIDVNLHFLTIPRLSSVRAFIFSTVVKSVLSTCDSVLSGFKSI